MLDTSIEAQIGDQLIAKGLTLGVAESCTGGLIGHTITNVPGSSVYFTGSIVSYAPVVKESLLGVGRETIEAYGAVSRETVIEMARGVRGTLQADIGLSVSGIAGPGGGTIDTPVGTVWICLCTNAFEQTWCCLFEGDRLKIKQQTSQFALKQLADYLMAQFEG